MIQIYRPDNLEFGKNGNMVLFPSSATVHAILNGDWEVNLMHPIDDEGRWKYIEDESVIKMPSFNGEQLFRVKSKTKTESGIEVTAVPIFLDSRDDCWLSDVRPTNKSGQDALNLITASNTKYSGESDIQSINTAYYQYMNLVEAINGSDTNAFVKRWGGEILYDNYKVIVNSRVGGDYGAKILYGKNIKADGIEEEVDFREVVTRIYPKSYNGYMMSNHGHVDSGLITKYPTVKARTITFEDIKMREDAQEDDEANGFIVCDNQAQLDLALRKKCQEQFEVGIDRPSVSISIDIVMLQNTEEYKEYAALESISFGDTVHCGHYNLGIETDARIVELEWDCIQEKAVSVVIGDFAYNYFKDVDSKVDRIDKAIRPDGSVVAEKIQGLINAMNASLQLQSTAAKKVDGRAFMIEDLDINSGLFGAMEAGTQGLRISKKRNPDNRSWLWTTAITALGIIADAIVTGSITSRNWVEDLVGFRFNLDEGTINSKHLKLDANGLLTIYKALISGGELTIGGADGNDGYIRIFDKDGTEIGRWDKDNGLDVKRGSIKGTSITLGGAGNKSGILTLLDSAGNLLVSLSNEGVYAKGKYICGSDKYGRSVEVSEGAFKILNRNGQEVGKLFAVSDKVIRLECGDVAIRFLEDSIYLDAQNIGPDGINGKSGRAEFSDGSYLDFRKGFLVGGKTAEGGTF